MKCTYCSKEIENNEGLCDVCKKNRKQIRVVAIIFLIIFFVALIMWNIPIVIISIIIFSIYLVCFFRHNINKTQKNRKRIIKTQIISSDSHKSMSSAITRATIGGTVLGPVGMIGGALSGKNKQKTTFLVHYSDGTKETMEVDNGGLLFKDLINYIEK